MSIDEIAIILEEDILESFKKFCNLNSIDLEEEDD